MESPIPLFHSFLQFRQKKITVQLVNSFNVGKYRRQCVCWQQSLGTALISQPTKKDLVTRKIQDYRVKEVSQELYCTEQHCTALHCCRLQYCAVLHSVLLCSALLLIVLCVQVLHCTVLYLQIVYCNVLNCTVLLYCTAVFFCTVLHCTAVLHCIALYSNLDIVLYCAVLHCTVLHYTVVLYFDCSVLCWNALALSCSLLYLLYCTALQCALLFSTLLFTCRLYCTINVCYCSGVLFLKVGATCVSYKLLLTWSSKCSLLTYLQNETCFTYRGVCFLDPLIQHLNHSSTSLTSSLLLLFFTSFNFH